MWCRTTGLKRLRKNIEFKKQGSDLSNDAAPILLCLKDSFEGHFCLMYNDAMTEQADIHKAGAVLLDGKGNFLVTRAAGKDIFVAPGGKLEEGESVLDALAREMMEEVRVEVNTETAEHLGTFQAVAAGNESKIVEMDVYLIHDSTGQPVPSSEIEEIMWVNTHTEGVPIGSIFEHDVMPLLKQRELIE